jgi:hypothetical protein
MEEIYVAILEKFAQLQSQVTALEQARRDDREAQKAADAQTQQWLILLIAVCSSLLAALMGVLLPLWVSSR